MDAEKRRQAAADFLFGGAYLEVQGQAEAGAAWDRASL